MKQRIRCHNKIVKLCNGSVVLHSYLFFLLWCCFILSYLLLVFFICVFYSLLLSVDVIGEAPRYAVFSALLSFHPSSVEISSSATVLKYSVYVPPLMSEAKFHAHIEP
jgi:hypothetical protein